MDPELQRILIRVGIAGTVIMAIAAGALIVAFRSFGPKDGKNRDFRAAAIIAAVLTFVMVCCVALFRMSMLR